jgi:imidazolonepropionase-like amidohydrolase
VPSAAGELALRGGGGGGGGGGGYPGTLFGVTALTRQVLIDAQTYANDPTAKKDQSFENLKPLVMGQIPALFAADSAREIVRATRIADEFKFKLMIYGGREAYRELGLLKGMHVPVILSVDVQDAPSKKMDTGEDATPQEVLNERYDLWQEHSMNPKVLNDAGVPLAFSLGSGFGDYLKGIRKMITTGLPRDAALKGMTLGAAGILGVSDKVGSIEVGKLANLVIMTGDFADDKSQIKSVVAEGTKIDLNNGGAK